MTGLIPTSREIELQKLTKALWEKQKASSNALAILGETKKKPLLVHSLEYKQARDKACSVYKRKYPKPDGKIQCCECGRTAKHRHHIVTMKTLIQMGLHLMPEWHICVYLCQICHELNHNRQIPTKT